METLKSSVETAISDFKTETAKKIEALEDVVEDKVYNMLMPVGIGFISNRSISPVIKYPLPYNLTCIGSVSSVDIADPDVIYKLSSRLVDEEIQVGFIKAD